MASIGTTIEIYDRVSQPMNSIIGSLYASMNAFNALNGVMSSGVNTSSIEAAVGDVQDLHEAIQETNSVPLAPAIDQAVSEYGQLARNAENTEKYIRRNASEQENFNRSIQGGIDQSTKLMDSIKGISQKNSDEAQTVSAATEEQSASMQEVAAASRELASLAADLQDAVGKFKLA